MERTVKDLMIDFETLGLDDNCVVLSIGAVAFDRDSFDLGEPFYATFVPFLDEQVGAGRTINPNTVMWWLQQSDEARQGLQDASGVDMFRDIGSLLSEFHRLFIDGTPVPAQRIWAKDPDFDVAILKSLWRSFPPIYNHPFPFKHNAGRSVRTIEDIGAGVSRAPFEGTPHNALDDAIAQAKRVQEVFAWLRSR